ncbi:MAG: hypothetical protein AVDCRST_MAG48-3361, partial [uncultured Friedmanniella sp.]
AGAPARAAGGHVPARRHAGRARRGPAGRRRRPVRARLAGPRRGGGGRRRPAAAPGVPRRLPHRHRRDGAAPAADL